jgi:hypothetical protein
MNAKQNIKMLLMALVAVNMLSACIIETDPYDGRTTTTTTTTTTTETESGPYYEEEVIVEEEVIIEEEVYVPPFHAQMGSVTGEVIDYDDWYETSWQLYTFNFTDVADTYTCGPNMSAVSEGTVATFYLHGFEVSDEFAACPEGRYTVVEECDLYEGEACVEIIHRDEFGHEVGTDWATYGVVNVRLLPARHHGEPHTCLVESSVDGHPDMSLGFELYFDSYDMAPGYDEGASICTM